MYLITRYSDLENRFKSSSTTCVKNSDYKLLLEWHHLDPVDDLERTRNDYGYTKQYNRNPFIDVPAYADAIWG